MAAKKKTPKSPKGAIALVPESKPRPSTPQKSPQKSRTKPKPQPRRPPPAPRRKSGKNLFFSTLLTSCLIYSLYQYIWTCPKDGSDTRLICDIGDHTLDIIEPPLYDAYDNYIEPYYAEYLSPYVGKATPHITLAYNRYVYPSYTYAVTQFEQHGRPQLVKVQKAAQAQYTRSIAPHVKVLEAKGWKLYDAYLADWVATGREAYGAYAPVAQKYAKQGYDFALEQAHPYYIAALPYLKTVWTQGIETAGWVGVEGKGWVARRWGMHVEPQLWRIQERLGLRGFAKNATPVKESEPTPRHHSNPNASSSDIRPDSNIETEDRRPPAEAPNGQDGEEPVAKSSAEQIQAAREKVEGDLAAWATKFEEAATTASNTVTRELNILCEKVMKEQTPISTDLLKTLDDGVAREFFNFEDGVLKLLDSPAEHKYVMVGYEGLVGRTNSDLKRRYAQIAEHTETFLMDTYQNTAKIVDAALADMDQVHDLGMQELGMKWAWMDGITYKDWARYHDLKKDFPALKTKVIRSGQGHKGLREVTDYAKSINDAATEVFNVAKAEIAKLEKQARKRLEDAGVEKEKKATSAGANADAAKNENDGKEVPQSDGKEVPEPRGRKEDPSEPAKDESNLPPDQGQKQSEQQEAPEAPLEQQAEKLPEPESQLEPESETEVEAEGSNPEAEAPQRESGIESEAGHPEPEAQQPESEPEPEARQPEPEAQAAPAEPAAQVEAEPAEPEAQRPEPEEAQPEPPAAEEEPVPEPQTEKEPVLQTEQPEPQAEPPAAAAAQPEPDSEPESKSKPDSQETEAAASSGAAASEPAEESPVVAAQHQEPKIQKDEL
ncbi:hypothetical protein TWF696_008204 [Orbilia brochopaga]|uniref:Uncharacterized protein n=1 Tax=Orbilia brochopaga TaxID=3140254 RepID=A0AAV9UIU5_9PEZI